MRDFHEIRPRPGYAEDGKTARCTHAFKSCRNLRVGILIDSTAEQRVSLGEVQHPTCEV
jgi:hypothetical protein